MPFFSRDDDSRQDQPSQELAPADAPHAAAYQAGSLEGIPASGRDRGHGAHRLAVVRRGERDGEVDRLAGMFDHVDAQPQPRPGHGHRRHVGAETAQHR